MLLDHQGVQDFQEDLAQLDHLVFQENQVSSMFVHACRQVLMHMCVTIMFS